MQPRQTKDRRRACHEFRMTLEPLAQVSVMQERRVWLSWVLIPLTGKRYLHPARHGNLERNRRILPRLSSDSDSVLFHNPQVPFNRLLVKHLHQAHEHIQHVGLVLSS